VQGDLKELFLSRLQESGSKRVKFLYWLDVLRFFSTLPFSEEIISLATRRAHHV